MNNYIKVLLYLKQFEGDGNYHNVENILTGMPFKHLVAILDELKEQEFIKLTGREQRYDSFIYTKNIISGESTLEESPFNELNKFPPKPYHGMITFKGSRYLKEELEMQQSGKYNINVTNGSTANLILESQNSNIANHGHVKKQIEKIVDTIQKDNSIGEIVKKEAISIFEQAMSDMDEQNIVTKSTWNNILSMGSNISSIGSLVLSLGQVIPKDIF